MVSIVIGVSLIILTSTLLAACFSFAYKFGYAKGLEDGSKQQKAVNVSNKAAQNYIKEYAKLMNYNG